MEPSVHLAPHDANPIRTLVGERSELGLASFSQQPGMQNFAQREHEWCSFVQADGKAKAASAFVLIFTDKGDPADREAEMRCSALTSRREVPNC